MQGDPGWAGVPAQSAGRALRRGRWTRPGRVTLRRAASLRLRGRGAQIAAAAGVGGGGGPTAGRARSSRRLAKSGERDGGNLRQK